jgi:hypothetical protein
MSASPVSNINPAEILASIAKLETDLAKMKIACGAAGVTLPVAKKAKNSVTGEKRAPNAWIVFTQKVDAALKAASISTGAATVSKQFASSLKDIKPYPEWTDSTIVAAWHTWEKPEQSKKASASDSEEAPKKERKKRGPMTEEQKAAAKAKRDAKKGGGGAEGGGGGTSASESDSDAPPPPVVAPHPPAAAPALVFNKKTAAKPSPFSLEQLSNFEPKDIEGAEHGVNCRGDVVDSDGNYIGKWNSKTKVLQRGGVVPADWAAILNAMTIPAPKD